MTLTISLFQRKNKFKPQRIVVDYLKLLSFVFSPKERENFLFLKKVGCLGIVFEGKINKEIETRFTSQTVKIAKKHFAVIRYLLIDKKEEINYLIDKLNSVNFGLSSFVLIEHTAKWQIYKGKNWLANYSPPRLTPENNIFLPQGSISAYFGFSKDNLGFYKQEKRGLNFIKRIRSSYYPEAVSHYYGKFLDTDNLEGLANKKETGLRHFTIGIYKHKEKPTLFSVKSENIEGNQAIVFTQNTQLVCSHFLMAKALKSIFCKKGKIAKFPTGGIKKNFI